MRNLVINLNLYWIEEMRKLLKQFIHSKGWILSRNISLIALKEMDLIQSGILSGIKLKELLQFYSKWYSIPIPISLY